MRQHLNIHEGYSDSVQRLFNALSYDTYIRPHRHASDPKVESLFALRGKFALIVFDEDGVPQQVVPFGADVSGSAVGVELAPESWHTVIALGEGGILLEIKAGPFNPNAAKNYAPWAPEEASGLALPYLAWLRKLAS